uniref:Ig-like domain-containing protein n=1 Tax=Electrophorus electricus TaxID=8005 RepID=A0AAY5ENM8_ELEEL
CRMEVSLVQIQWTPRNPDPQVFVGETVTLRCDIQGSSVYRWQYSWKKEGSERTISSEQQYNIGGVKDYHEGEFTCRGTEAGGSRYSHTSDAVTLTVSGESRPKAVASIKPDPQVFVGETVTLRCDIQGSSVYRWQYSWKKEGSERTISSEQQYNIGGVKDYHEGEFTCRGTEAGGSRYSHTSDAVTLTVSGESKPKPTVKVKPQTSVYTGDTVTLSCEVQQSTGWMFLWNIYPQQPKSWTTVRKNNIMDVTVSEEATSEYGCGARRGQYYTHYSDVVKITAAGKPKAVASIKPDPQVFEGETVTLRCNIQRRGVSKWQYSWKKEGSLSPVSREQVYTISGAEESHTGNYTCRGTEAGGSRYSHTSDAVTLTVSGEYVSSLVSLIIIPNRTQHFSGHSLSLSCEDQRNSTKWRVMQYTQNRSVSNCPPGKESVTRSTCNISSLSTAHTGVYWCQSKSLGSSKPVNITVHDGDVILDSPVHPVTEGDSLTLRCLLNKTSSNLISYFYKDGSLFWNQTTGQIIIHAILKSDEGLYHCEYPERKESPKSWVSVRGLGPGSSGVIVGPAVGLSLTLLLIIILILFLSYKKNKGLKASMYL